eukprot:scaffold51658_cov62-Phaeocystis_antarctica.AAC.1
MPRNAGASATVDDLSRRVAMLWFGQEVVAAAVYRHSHEEYPPSGATPASTRKRRSDTPRQTEILLFGVSDDCRRK